MIKRALVVRITSVFTAMAVLMLGLLGTGTAQAATPTPGKVWAWGANDAGQLGDGTTNDSPVPVEVVGGLAFSEVVATYQIACGITAAGTAYCWGEGASGQIGNGAYSNVSQPTEVSGGHTFSQIFVGGSNPTVCGLTTAGSAYCWGEGSSGQIGNSAASDVNVPTAVSGGLTFSNLDIRSGTVCGLTTAGAAYCWGEGSNGQIGNGAASDVNVPTAVSGSHTFRSIMTRGNETCGLTTAGAAYCWGAGGSGRLGNGSSASVNVPSAVSGGHTFKQVEIVGGGSVCGITTANTAYCWGAGSEGQIGNGATGNVAVPTAVSGGHSFAVLTGGSTSVCGLTTAGAAMCWGDGDNGEIGNGADLSVDVPTAVSGGHVFAMISNKTTTVCGVTTTDSAYCWGYGSEGQIGNGATSNVNVPTAVAGSHAFNRVIVDGASVWAWYQQDPAPPTPKTQKPLNGCVTAGATSRAIPRRGQFRLMKPKCVTNAGRAVGMKVTGATRRGDLVYYRLFCLNRGRLVKTVPAGYGSGFRKCRAGAMVIKTYGTPLRLRVTWFAPKTGPYALYKRIKNYAT